MDGGNLFGQEQKKRPKISHSSIECYFDTSIEFRHSAFLLLTAITTSKYKNTKQFFASKWEQEEREKLKILQKPEVREDSWGDHLK